MVAIDRDRQDRVRNTGKDGRDAIIGTRRLFLCDQHVGPFSAGGSQRILGVHTVSNDRDVLFRRQHVVDDRAQHARHLAKVDTNRIHGVGAICTCIPVAKHPPFGSHLTNFGWTPLGPVRIKSDGANWAVAIFRPSRDREVV